MNKGLPDAIADTSTQHRSLHLSFLLLCVYAAVIVGATKDRQFLLDSEITLPLLGIGLPIQEVYIVLPLMLLILHGNLLLQTLFLSQRIARLPAREQSECALNVSTFPVIQAMFPATEKTRISVLLWSVVLILLVIIPVSLFLLIQIRALVLQSGALTLWHQLLLSIDIILLWSLWPFRSVTHADRTKTRILALASSIIILYFTWFDATAVNSKITHLPQTANLTDLIFRRHLDVNGEILVKSSEKPREYSPATTTGLEFAEDGQYRSLRFANFRNTVLVNADFGNTDLYGASFVSANLTRAKFGRRDIEQQQIPLYKVIVNRLKAFFMGSESAHIQEKQRAILEGVYFTDTTLDGANLKGFDLSGSKFFGASLRAIDLTNASLSGSNLLGADLTASILRRADLSLANLLASDLHGANLAMANLNGADTRFAKLGNTILVGASAHLADLRYTRYLPLTAEQKTALGDELKQLLPEGQALYNQLFINELEFKVTKYSSSQLFWGFSSNLAYGALTEGSNLPGAEQIHKLPRGHYDRLRAYLMLLASFDNHHTARLIIENIDVHYKLNEVIFGSLVNSFLQDPEQPNKNKIQSMLLGIGRLNLDKPIDTPAYIPMAAQLIANASHCDAFATLSPADLTVLPKPNHTSNCKAPLEQPSDTSRDQFKRWLARQIASNTTALDGLKDWTTRPKSPVYDAYDNGDTLALRMLIDTDVQQANIKQLMDWVDDPQVASNPNLLYIIGQALGDGKPHDKLLGITAQLGHPGAIALALTDALLNNRAYLLSEEHKAHLKAAVEQYNADALLAWGLYHQREALKEENAAIARALGDTARTYLHMAAIQGSSIAAFELGKHYETGQLLQRNATQATEWYTRAAQYDDMPQAHLALALLLASHPGKAIRDGQRALRVMTRCPDQASHQALSVLAAVHAELGWYEGAQSYQKKALQQLQESGIENTTLEDDYQQRLRLYQSNKPLRRY